MQEDQRVKKHEKENYVAPEPYKLKEFKNVESRLMNIPTKNYDSDKPEKKVVKSISTLNKGSKSQFKKSNTLTVFNKKQADVKKVIKKSNQPDDEEEENIMNFGKVIGPRMVEYNSNNEVLNISNKENEKYFQNERRSLKGPTPKSNEINNLNPKSNKNYILENRMKVTQNDVPVKAIKKEEPQQAIHKDFGKTPEYLLKYKADAEKQKEYQKMLEEQKKYPAGTRLLSEEERLETLNSLSQNRKDIITLLEKMPISMKSMAIQNKKTELENKLNELESAIRTFSRKQVFIKAD
jgi:hypothetical protein